MAENSRIEWTDHTFNPWVGCEKVSPGCDHCYAESWAKRAGNPGLWQGERRRTTASNWRQPIKWNAAAKASGTRARVFCASLADVFDNAVSDEWRKDLFNLILCTPHLDWLLLTKRIGNAQRMLPLFWDGIYDNVWIGATIVNQEEADRDVPKLLATPARVRFLSCEPLMGPIDLRLEWLSPFKETDPMLRRVPRVDWVIVGGESGHHARPVHAQWVRLIRDQCVAAGVPFFWKQWGEFIPADQHEARKFAYDDERCEHVWDASSPTGYSIRVGKKQAGRVLDGRTWDQFPQREKSQ